MAKSKLTEKMLFSVFLDLHYALSDYDINIEDMTQSLKDMKKNRAKTKRLLGKATAQYEKINGRKPRAK